MRKVGVVQVPHVQSYLVAVDQIGFAVLKKAVSLHLIKNLHKKSHTKTHTPPLPGTSPYAEMILGSIPG